MMYKIITLWCLWGYWLLLGLVGHKRLEKAIASCYGLSGKNALKGRASFYEAFYSSLFTFSSKNSLSLGRTLSGTGMETWVPLGAV